MKKVFFLFCLSLFIFIKGGGTKGWPQDPDQDPDQEDHDELRPVGKVVSHQLKAEMLIRGALTPIPLKVGHKIYDKTILTTKEKSVLQLTLLDKTSLTLGPNSQLELNSFSASRAGVMTLLTGSVRVTREESPPQPEVSYHLFIKTANGVLGIQGNDFLTIYNPKIDHTLAISFAGQAFLAKSPPQTLSPGSLTSFLEELRTLEQVSLLTEGTFALVGPHSSRPNFPVRFSPVQFHSLKTNHLFEIPPLFPNRAPRPSLLPPGVVEYFFAERPADLLQLVAETTGQDYSDLLPKAETDPLPLEKYTPAAGGILDLQQGLYFPPETGSAYDPITLTFSPPLQGILVYSPQPSDKDKEESSPFRLDKFNYSEDLYYDEHFQDTGP